MHLDTFNHYYLIIYDVYSILSSYFIASKISLQMSYKYIVERLSIYNMAASICHFEYNIHDNFTRCLTFTVFDWHLLYEITTDIRGVGGLLKLFFDRVCGLRSKIPTHIKGFSPSKNGWIYTFPPQNFRKSGLISKGFSTTKMAEFTIFFTNFFLLRIFLIKMGPMSTDFWWKSNPFGRNIPVCRNMWVPPLRYIKEIPDLVYRPM